MRFLRFGISAHPTKPKVLVLDEDPFNYIKAGGIYSDHIYPKDSLSITRRLPRPSPAGKALVHVSDFLRHQLHLHREGWTALDKTVEVAVGNYAPLWDDTEIALGWSPPGRGPQERAWLITEKNRKGRGPDGKFLPKEKR